MGQPRRQPGRAGPAGKGTVLNQKGSGNDRKGCALPKPAGPERLAAETHAKGSVLATKGSGKEVETQAKGAV